MSPGGFNADSRAKDREQGPVTIGGVTYHPARLTNKQLRKVRAMSRTAGREARRLAKGTEEYREAYDEAIEDGEDEKRARELAEQMGMTSEEVSELTQDSLVEQLGVLLVTDGAQPPEPDRIRQHLEEDLDFRDVESLMAYLLGSEDPSRPERTETTTERSS